MRAILTFNLPKEQEEFEDALKGGAYRAALLNVQAEFRNQRKYSKPVDIEYLWTVIHEEIDDAERREG